MGDILREKSIMKVKLFLTTLILIALSITGCSTDSGILTDPESTDIWKKYVGLINDADIPRLPNYSYAGYKLGKEGLPETHDLPRFDVTEYGATANDSTSDQAAIQAAIDAAEASGGGVVFFPPGEFLINTNPNDTNSITVRSSNIVLKGSGSTPGGTVLNMKNHMLLPPGTQPWGTPPMISFSSSSVGTKTNVTQNSDRGSKTIHVANASLFQNEKYLILDMPSNQSANNDFLERKSPRSIWSTILNNGTRAIEYHEIAAVNTSNNTVTLTDPVIDNIKAVHNWTAQPVRLLEGCGFEDIHFKGNFTETFVHHKDYIHDYAWHAIYMNRVAHSWVTRSRFTDVTKAAAMNGSYASSMILLYVDGNRGHELVNSKGGSSRILMGLIWDNTNGGQWHGVGASHHAAGSVVWRIDAGQSRGWDFHGAQPRTTLVDLYHSNGMSGSGANYVNLPNHLGSMTIWNQRRTGSSVSNYDFWEDCGSSNYCSGAAIVNPIIVGYHGSQTTFKQSNVKYEERNGARAKPESLYEAQLQHRLGYAPSWVKAAIDEYNALKSSNWTHSVTPPEGSIVDAYVRDGTYADDNYGFTGSLVVKNDGTSYKREALLKFDLSDINGNVSSAKLSMTIASFGSTTTSWNANFIANDNWNENSITWNNKPTTGALLDNQPGKTSGSVEWDITNQVAIEAAGDRKISLNISATDSTYVTFYSKDHADVSLHPRLIIETEGGPQ